MTKKGQKLLEFKQQTCAAYQDLPTLQFLSKSEYPFWSRLKYEKLTDGRRTPSDGNTSHDPLGQVS